LQEKESAEGELGAWPSLNGVGALQLLSPSPEHAARVAVCSGAASFNEGDSRGLHSATWIQFSGMEAPAEIATVIIAAAVGFITYRQWRSAADEFRFALFEKRYEIFKATHSFMSAVAAGEFKQTDITDFDTARTEAYFLFGNDPQLMRYLREIRDQAQKYRGLQTKAKVERGIPQGDATIEEMEKCLSWFFDQIDRSKEEFAPFLSFPHKMKQKEQCIFCG
jgi:hypothetical protein